MASHQLARAAGLSLRHAQLYLSVRPQVDLVSLTSPRNLETEQTPLQAQERLFEQLMQLLATAAGPAGARGGALRQLSCKAEEVHTTLRKHLAKEEEQLFPLLLAHFSVAEQAELVAQFLCCIPLAAVEAVLAWLKPAVPQAEQEELLAQARPRQAV